MSALYDQAFYFLRHGETEANAADIIAGTLDSPLTERGRAQAGDAANILKNNNIASIWASPLSRAWQTAEATARATGAPMFAHPGLAERAWGEWEGQPRSVLVREAKPEGGESPAEFRARILAALAEITGPFPVLIVAHSGTAREIHNALRDAPFERLDNAVPIIWQKDEQGHWNYKKLS